MSYVEIDKVVEKYEEFHVGEPDLGSKIEDLKNVLNASIPIEAFWVEQKEDGVTSYHCSACKRCWYIKKPKARFCPECGTPISGGLEC